MSTSHPCPIHLLAPPVKLRPCVPPVLGSVGCGAAVRRVRMATAAPAVVKQSAGSTGAVTRGCHNRATPRDNRRVTAGEHRTVGVTGSPCPAAWSRGRTVLLSVWPPDRLGRVCTVLRTGGEDRGPAQSGVCCLAGQQVTEDTA